MIMTRRSARYCVDREDVGGVREKRDNSALLTLYLLTSTQRAQLQWHKGTQHRSLNVLFRTTQFVTISYLRTIDRLERKFTY
jgi:hypothetical protein